MAAECSSGRKPGVLAKENNRALGEGDRISVIESQKALSPARAGSNSFSRSIPGLTPRGFTLPPSAMARTEKRLDEPFT